MQRDPGWVSPSLSSSETEYRAKILPRSPLQAMKDLECLQRKIVHMTPVADHTHSPLLVVHPYKIRCLSCILQPAGLETKQADT